MKKLIQGTLIVGLGLLSLTGRAENDESVLRESARAFLRSVIEAILKDPDTSPYFAEKTFEEFVQSRDTAGTGHGWTPVTLGPQFVATLRKNRGWVSGFHYRHDVHLAPNPNKSEKRSDIDVFENDHALIFEIYVSYKQAGRSTGRPWMAEAHTFPVSENLEVCTSLAAKGNSDALRKRIDVIIKAELPPFQKNVGAV